VSSTAPTTNSTSTSPTSPNPPATTHTTSSSGSPPANSSGRRPRAQSPAEEWEQRIEAIPTWRRGSRGRASGLEHEQLLAKMAEAEAEAETDSVGLGVYVLDLLGVPV
jgi:hypothetical protein